MKYALRRLLLMIPVLWAIYTITFLMVVTVPGNPFQQPDRQMPEGGRTGPGGPVSHRGQLELLLGVSWWRATAGLRAELPVSRLDVHADHRPVAAGVVHSGRDGHCPGGGGGRAGGGGQRGEAAFVVRRGFAGGGADRDIAADVRDRNGPVAAAGDETAMAAGGRVGGRCRNWCCRR